MDELKAARISRDIERLRTTHHDEGLVDPFADLNKIAERHGVDVESLLAAFTSGDNSTDSAK